MKKAFLPVAALAVLGVVSIAQAATMQGNGTIKSIDAKTHTVTLSDGQILNVQPAQDLTKLKAGEKVSYAYESKDGKMWAENFKPAK